MSELGRPARAWSAVVLVSPLCTVLGVAALFWNRAARERHTGRKTQPELCPELPLHSAEVYVSAYAALALGELGLLVLWFAARYGRRHHGRDATRTWPVAVALGVTLLGLLPFLVETLTVVWLYQEPPGGRIVCGDL